MPRAAVRRRPVSAIAISGDRHPSAGTTGVCHQPIRTQMGRPPRGSAALEPHRSRTRAKCRVRFPIPGEIDPPPVVGPRGDTLVADLRREPTRGSAVRIDHPDVKMRPIVGRTTSNAIRRPSGDQDGEPDCPGPCVSCCGFDPSASADPNIRCRRRNALTRTRALAIRRETRLHLSKGGPHDQLHGTPHFEAVDVGVRRHACERQPVARQRHGWRSCADASDLHALGRAAPGDLDAPEVGQPRDRIVVYQHAAVTSPGDGIDIQRTLRCQPSRRSRGRMRSIQFDQIDMAAPAPANTVVP